jgi:hypothetical protein
VFGAALVDPKVPEVGDIDTSFVAIRLSCGTVCQIGSGAPGTGMMSASKVFGPKGLVESRRQRAEGCCVISVIKSSKIGLHAGRFEPWSKASTRPWTLSSGRFTKGIQPSSSLEGGFESPVAGL